MIPFPRFRRGAASAVACAAVALLIALGACARPTPPPAPAPAPSAAQAKARRDSIRAAEARREAAERRARAETTFVRVCAGGDVSLGTNLDTTWARYASRKLHRRVRALPPPESLLRPLRPLVRDGDVLLLNVEGAIGEGTPAFQKCGPKSTACFALRQPPAVARALRALLPDGAVVANVANNHARDAGAAGWTETIARLDRAGVHVVGADTLPTLVVSPAGDTVAILGFSTSVGPDLRDLDAVRRHVARAAALQPRLVVTMHLGAEGKDALRVRDSTELFHGESRGNPVAFANAAVESGAALVIGHGPHVVRAMQWRGDALVAYSLGNLVTYGPFSFREPMSRGALLCASVSGTGKVRDARVTSTRQKRPGLVARDRSGRAAALIDSLSRADFGDAGARVARDGAVRMPAVSSRR